MITVTVHWKDSSKSQFEGISEIIPSSMNDRHPVLTLKINEHLTKKIMLSEAKIVEIRK